MPRPSFLWTPHLHNPNLVCNCFLSSYYLRHRPYPLIPSGFSTFDSQMPLFSQIIFAFALPFKALSFKISVTEIEKINTISFPLCSSCNNPDDVLGERLPLSRCSGWVWQQGNKACFRTPRFVLPHITWGLGVCESSSPQLRSKQIQTLDVSQSELNFLPHDWKTQLIQRLPRCWTVTQTLKK